MKKSTFKITRGLKAALLVGGLTVASLFGAGRTTTKKAVYAFAPMALIGGMKKKGITMSDDEEKLLKGIEDEANAAFKAMQDELITTDAFKAKMDELAGKIPTTLTAKAITIPGTGDKNADGTTGADKTLDEMLRDYGTQLKSMQDALKDQGNSGDFQSMLKKSLEETMPKLKALKQERGGAPFEISMTVKGAAANMTTGNAIGNASGQTIPVAYVYQQVRDYASDVRVDQYIINYLDNGSTNMASMPYMDKLPTNGTMAITAEGALKPLISITFELRYSTAFKIAGRTKISEEALDDIPAIMAIINNELRFQHDIAEQNAIFTKVASFAPAFVAGGLAATTVAPTNYDVIRAAIYAIKISSKGRFIPNAALVNSVDVYAMGATKDTTNQYVYPPFVSPDGTMIAGVKIVETQDTTNIPAGTYIVGDWRKLHRRVYKEFTLRMGQGIVSDGSTVASVQSDFETNMYTMIGESRLHLWIYNNEIPAFIKSTFAATKTAITT